jgi:cephalosporin hydroxylase
MKLTIDDAARTITDHETGRVFDLFSPEAFEWLSREWLRVGWSLKYVYSFTWLGRPLIQLPDDVIRLQEVIYTVKPDVIVETGIAHGGGLLFYASLCKAIGRGRVVGVDIEIRPHNRRAIESHELFPLITLLEGDSASPAVVQQVRRQVRRDDQVLVILDSNHSKAHVSAELEAYAPLVTPGSYIVATDGSMEFLADVPRGNPDWTWNNPKAAASEFASAHPEFCLEEPPWRFNEGEIRLRVTHWPGAYLRRRPEPAT